MTLLNDFLRSRATLMRRVEKERAEMLARGWTPYWSELAGCDAWKPPVELDPKIWLDKHQ